MLLPCVARPGAWQWLPRPAWLPLTAGLLLLLPLPELLLLNRIMSAESPAGADTRLLLLSPGPRAGSAAAAELPLSAWDALLTPPSMPLLQRCCWLSEAGP